MNKAGHIVTACIVASLFATAFGGLGVVIILSPLAFLVLFIYAVRQFSKAENANGNAFFYFFGGVCGVGICGFVLCVLVFNGAWQGIYEWLRNFFKNP